MLTIKVRVDVIVKLCAAAEINQTQLVGLGVDENVFIFDVPVDDALFVAAKHAQEDLSEEALGQPLGKVSGIGDVVKEILAVVKPLHDQEKTIRHLEEVQKFDHSGNVGDFSHECDFQRNSGLVVLLAHSDDSGLGDQLDGDGKAVFDPLAGIDGAETTLSENGSHGVMLGKLSRTGERV